MGLTGGSARTVVIIPTYNEIASLPVQVESVRVITPEADILVVDDASPDGTGKWAQARSELDDQVFALHRTAKNGLGAAYLDGFRWALERGYEVIVEMDADGSHQARQLPDLLDAPGEWDLVIGSRWVPGGSVVNWPRHREWLSRGANRYVRAMLGMPVRDATAGYRAYRAAMLCQLNLDKVVSAGYCFQVDMAWRVARAGGTIVEVPIEFKEREMGASKMTMSIIAEALIRVTWWGVSHRVRRLFRRA